MSVSLSWERQATHVVVRLSGSPSLEQVLPALDAIATATRGDALLLVDMRGIDTLLAFTDQFALGQAAAEKLRHLRRVASVVAPDRLTRNSERPARKQGMDLRVFTSEAEALVWLLEQP